MQRGTFDRAALSLEGALHDAVREFEGEGEISTGHFRLPYALSKPAWSLPDNLANLTRSFPASQWPEISISAPCPAQRSAAPRSLGFRVQRPAIRDFCAGSSFGYQQRMVHA